MENQLKFENSLFYPCSAFDGFIFSAVNTCDCDNQQLDLDIINYIYVNHSQNYQIDTDSISEVKKLYDRYCDELNSINQYTFEKINFNQITNNLYTEYLISIDLLLPILYEYTSALDEVYQNFENVNNEGEDQNTFKLDQEDYKLAFEFSHEYERILNLFLTTKENKKIVFCVKGTKNIENFDAPGKEFIYLTFIMDNAVNFYNNFLNEQKIAPKVFVMKTMGEAQNGFLAVLNNHHFIPKYVIIENQIIPTNYGVIANFRQNQDCEFVLCLRKD